MKIVKVNGFTIIESMVVLSITLLLFVLVIPNYRSYQNKSDLQALIDEIVGQLSLVREKTVSSHSDSNWGLRIAASSTPQELILFKGISYDSRELGADITTSVNPTANITAVNFGGQDWVVFERVTGRASTSGYVSLELSSDFSRAATVYLNKEGLTSLEPFEGQTSSGRIVDSRHIHIEYYRPIDTASEDIELIFDAGGTPVIETIPISDNLVNGQIFWSGQIDVNGSVQNVDIRTHALNDPDTIFSIFREIDKNDKSMALNLSGDGLVLALYDADGSTVATGSSAFVSLVEWQ